MQCVSCGQENSESAKFCQNCGRGLAEQGEPSEAPAVEALPEPMAATDASAEAITPAVGPAPSVASAAPTAEEETPQVLPASIHPKFAPITVEQAAALLHSEKRYPWISVPAGVVSFVALLAGLAALDSQGSYYLPVSILTAAAIYLGTHFLLLPAVWPATVHCPHCGKQVPTAKNALPKVLWPWACPHCNQELAPEPA